MVVLSRGVAYFTTVNRGGRLYVSSGGIARSTIVDFFGEMHISSGGSAEQTTISHGDMFVTSSGSADRTTISGGDMFVSFGGIVTKTTIEFGRMVVSSGGVATSTTINSNGSMNIESGGTASHIIVSSGGNLFVSSNSIAQDVSVLEGGFINGFIIQPAYYTSIVGGALDINDAVVTAVVTHNFAQIFSGGKATRTTISQGSLHVNKGGIAISSLLRGSAHLGVGGGGTATDTTVSSGGCLYIAAGTTINATISSGGRIWFETMRSSATHTTILSGGEINGFTLQKDTFYDSIIDKAVDVDDAIVSTTYATISSGGIARNTTITSRGCTRAGGMVINTKIIDGALYISPEGSATTTILASNASMFISSGATATGLNIADGAVVSMYQGSTLNFDLTQGDSNSAAQVNNLALINGTPDYAITVSGNTKAGTYRLADGASNFNGTITIRNSTANLGSIMVGSSLKIGNTSYTLNKKDGQLTLTVTGTTAARTVKSDINGNGISDVMFQYNADHQVGFWLDGKNNWQGQGLAEPAEWQVLGAYDMDSNGKADVVMFGNVTVNGVKSVYIGFRKDADTSTWQNISYLTNYNNIVWNVKVGNITGNAGKNSIVWHAPELGALGIWADGTNQWVSIASGFDNSWDMLGTGDFDGDGKDEILFRNNANLYTVNINGKFASLGSAFGWKVCAIGDFSGDGKDDLVLYHQQTGSIMKYENGLSSSWTSLGQLDAKDWFIVGAGDYNGDGKDDLLVRQYSTGMLGYYSGGDINSWREMGRGVDMNWAVIA